MRNAAKMKVELRSERRKKVAISAEIIDPKERECYHCLIIDASSGGCRVICDSVEMLPDAVQLQPEGASKPIRASIRWRKGMTAGLKLDWAETLFD